MKQMCHRRIRSVYFDGILAVILESCGNNMNGESSTFTFVSGIGSFFQNVDQDLVSCQIILLSPAYGLFQDFSDIFFDFEVCFHSAAMGDRIKPILSNLPG